MTFQRKGVPSRNLHMKITQLDIQPKQQARQNLTPLEPLDSYLNFQPNIPTSTTRNEDDNQLKKRIISLELQTREQQEINQNLNDFLSQQQQIINQLVSEMNLLTKRFHSLDSEMVNMNQRVQDVENQTDIVNYKDSFSRQIQSINTQMNVVNTRLEIISNEKNSKKNTYVLKDEWQWGQNVITEQIKTIETAIKNFQFSTQK